MSLLSSLLGCAGSSTDLPNSPSAISVKAEVEDLSEPRYETQRVRVVLTNAKGAAIERDDIAIEMNGTRMRFRVGQGNYYDRHPYYAIDPEDHVALTPGSMLRFVLIMPDSARHEIGTLVLPAALTREQIGFPRTPPTTGPVTFAWRDLLDSAEVQIGRSVQHKQADGNYVMESTGPYDPNALRRTIGPGMLRKRTDAWVLPESLVATSAESRLLSLQVYVTSTTTGKVSKAFAKTSTLQAVRRLTFEMEFAESN